MTSSAIGARSSLADIKFHSTNAHNMEDTLKHLSDYDNSSDYDTSDQEDDLTKVNVWIYTTELYVRSKSPTCVCLC